MNQKLFFVLLISGFCVCAHDVVALLKKKADQPGIQVGLLIDAHSGGTSFFEIVDVKGKKPLTAYDVIQNSKAKHELHPQYQTPPMVMIHSFFDQKPDQTKQGYRNWSFFNYEKGTWVLSEKGVAQTPIVDGSLIGFSRTPWIVKDGIYQAVDPPRMP